MKLENLRLGILAEILAVFFFAGIAMAGDQPKPIEELSKQFDEACQNLLQNKPDKAEAAVEQTIQLLEDNHEKSKGRAKKMMSTDIKELKRFKRDIAENNLRSRVFRLESLYRKAESALWHYLRQVDGSIRKPKVSVLGTSGKCVAE